MSKKTYQTNEVVSCVDEGEDGAMLYNPDKDDTVILNPSGRSIWALLSSPRTLNDIASSLVAAYPCITQEQARKDAEQFLQSLVPDFVTTSTDEH
ncbi:PqqD family protein [candidate division WOR-3 bacterium]|nr:PqqD family protein [candidate division WOR-3 bacterium]